MSHAEKRKAAIAHHYRRLRADGCTAEAAYWGARRHLHFMATMRAEGYGLGRTRSKSKRRKAA